MVFHRGNASMNREEANTCKSSTWQRLFQHVLLLAVFSSKGDKQETVRAYSPTAFINFRPTQEKELGAFCIHGYSRGTSIH